MTCSHSAAAIPAIETGPSRREAANRYALAALLWERWPCELTQSLRLAALRDVLRARCGA